MKDNRVNIGIAGVANHGQTILRAIGGCENLVLKSCFDVNEEAAAGVARKTGCRRASTYEELVGDKELDAVALVTPNFVHLDQAVKALNSGKHVFVEKPFALNVHEGKQIVEAGRKNGKIIQVGHNTRKRTSFREARRLIGSGELGDIVSVYANMSFDFGLTKDVPEWKKQKDKCPLLPMTQLGIHFIDTLEYLVGKIESVSAVQRSAVLKDEKGNPVTDSVAAVLSFENGVIGSIQSDYVSPSTYTIVVFGTKAKITCGDSEIMIERPSAGKTVSEMLPAKEKIDGESYFAEIAEFAECVLTRRPPEVDGEVGLRNLAVIEAMLLSAESSRSVTVSQVLESA
jgi:predicted dehydrogenase